MREIDTRSNFCVRVSCDLRQEDTSSRLEPKRGQVVVDMRGSLTNQRFHQALGYRGAEEVLRKHTDAED